MAQLSSTPLDIRPGLHALDPSREFDRREGEIDGQGAYQAITRVER
jgi:hypothetical protein